MKTILKLKKTTFFAFILMTVFSCSKNDDKVTTDFKNLSDVVSNEPRLSMVDNALKRTDIMARFQTNDQFTFFAPTNEALTTFLNAKGYTLDTVPNDVLRNILLNHIVLGKKLSTDLNTGYLKSLSIGAASSTSNLSLYIYKTSSSIKLNGRSNVINPDVIASNGVIHFVDTVIDLPTISDQLIANSDFSEFVAAYSNVFVIGPSQPEIVTLLNSTNIKTVFAPTNQAFSVFKTELLNTYTNGWSDISMDRRVKLVKYHIVSNNFVSSMLSENLAIPSLLLPQFFTIQLSPSIQIKDASNRISRIIFTDIQCANGSIHVLDKVLKPSVF
jgi:uncharacterized surface protein with fasciclin (FAS1) repeats